jgi:transcriptional antiterminator RfaH
MFSRDHVTSRDCISERGQPQDTGHMRDHAPESTCDGRAAAPSIAASACWYAVQSKAQQEQRAEMNLRSLGLETFLPMTRSTTPRHEWTTGGRAQALFPRYLFVRCEIVPFAHKIRYTRGVTKILRTAEGPSIVADWIIMAIMDRVGDDGFVRLSRPLMAGDRVRVTSGPFKEFVGVFHATTGASERARLLLTAVNGNWKIVLNGELVERIG